jgi:hypothetical protein
MLKIRGREFEHEGLHKGAQAAMNASPVSMVEMVKRMV